MDLNRTLIDKHDRI
uniref:Uncharacterized protein n=1 Tax=Arundo donax TaxID=35708 RepID=A0A0A8ZEI7_ARUDO